MVSREFCIFQVRTCLITSPCALPSHVLIIFVGGCLPRLPRGHKNKRFTFLEPHGFQKENAKSFVSMTVAWVTPCQVCGELLFYPCGELCCPKGQTVGFEQLRLPSLQQSWKLTAGFWTTPFFLGKPWLTLEGEQKFNFQHLFGDFPPNHNKQTCTFCFPTIT